MKYCKISWTKFNKKCLLKKKFPLNVRAFRTAVGCGYFDLIGQIPIRLFHVGFLIRPRTSCPNWLVIVLPRLGVGGGGGEGVVNGLHGLVPL